MNPNPHIEPKEMTAEERLRECDTVFEVNASGLWCIECGEHIAPPWFFNDEDYQPPLACKQCGFPHD